MFKVPVRNDTSAEILVGLEPEGDTIPLGPGETCIIKSIDPVNLAALDFHIEYSHALVSICMMCDKIVFVEGQQVR